MYSYDVNTNTAIERQADRVRAVQAYGSRQAQGQADQAWMADNAGRTSPLAPKIALALAAAAPIMLVVAWGLLAR